MRDDELASDLDEYMAGAEPPDDYDAEPEPPRDAEGAERLLRRLRGAQRQRAKVDALAAAEVARIESWRSDRVAGFDRQAAWLERSLEGWMRQTNQADPRTKTVKLPSGEVKLRSGRQRVEVTAASVFVEWAQAHAPKLVRTTVAPDKTAIAAYAAASFSGDTLDGERHCIAFDPEGEVIPGIEIVEPVEPTFSVKVSE